MSGARRLRERVALALAPWLYVPHREHREEAFRDLAEVAYGRRDAIWTSPRALVKRALRRADQRGAERALECVYQFLPEMLAADMRTIGRALDEVDRQDLLPPDQVGSALQALVNLQHSIVNARSVRVEDAP